MRRLVQVSCVSELSKLGIGGGKLNGEEKLKQYQVARGCWGCLERDHNRWVDIDHCGLNVDGGTNMIRLTNEREWLRSLRGQGDWTTPWVTLREEVRWMCDLSFTSPCRLGGYCAKRPKSEDVNGVQPIRSR